MNIPTNCWPQPSCERPREWAVFHDAEAADRPFDPLTSVYIGVCSEHLTQALRFDPAAVNVVRPYPQVTVQ